MAATLESELKYRAETDASLLALAAPARLGPARLGPARTVDEVDRYLDTASGLLARARWACRLRTREGRIVVSLKGPAQHAEGAALHRRPELEGPAAEGLDPRRWPVSPARDLLLALSGDGPLVERLSLAQRRTEREVVIEGRRVGTLSLDRARVIHRDAEIGVLRVVELELVAAAMPTDDELHALEAALAVVPGLTPDAASKLERALALLDGQPA